MAGLRLDLKRVDKDLTAQLAMDVGNAQEDCEHGQETIDPLSDDYCPEDRLSPMEKVQKYHQSEDVMEREIAIRNIIDAAYSIAVYCDFEAIVDIICGMATDQEPLIRMGALSTVISMLERNIDFREVEGVEINQECDDKLFEIPIRMLNDFNQQVRRVSHNTVVMILEELKNISLISLVNKLCEMIKKCLGKDESYDLRMDTVMLISRVCPHLSQEMCVEHFLPLLHPLASDPTFHVRKSFVGCCKDLCRAVGEGHTEEFILPLFLHLCKDEVWGVRMACADVFMDMSLSCSLLTRQERLTPVFLHLLKDDSKWVRKAAFQSLGPFISTFSVVSSQNETSESLEPLSDGELLDNSLLGETPSVTMTTTSTRSLAQTRSDTARSQTDSNDLTPPKSVTPPKPLTPPLSDQEILQDEFNLFQYWRSPIQPLALDNETSATTTAPNVASTIEPANTSPSQSSSVPEDSDEISGAQGGVTNHIFNSLRNHQGLIEGVAREEEVASRYESEGNHDDGDGLTDIKDELLAESEGVADESCDIFDYKINQKLPLGSNINGLPQVRVTFVQNTTEENPIGNLGVPPNESMLLKTSMEMSLVEMSNISEPFYVTGSDQDVVPQELIDIYLSMTDPTKAQSVDLDLPLYCAFSFPAVLQTLGPDHWQLLKPTFMILSRDVQWKIRRVLSYSLHELAKIVGQEKTVDDLLTVIEEYATKDLDDIKMGILQHLSELFEILPPKVRADYFPAVLSGLLDVENERNWRYRDMLALQLSHLCDMFDCVFVEQHIVGIGLKLCHDKVAQVRHSSSKLIGIILQKFSQSNPSFCSAILKNINELFAKSDRWLLRLMYIKQCEILLQNRWISYSLFSVECLPSILALSTDPIPNLRLAVGRLLNDTITRIEFFNHNYSLSFNIQSTLQTLRGDTDKDVRYYSGGDPSDPSPVQPLSLSSHNITKSNNTKFDIAEAASLLHLS